MRKAISRLKHTSIARHVRQVYQLLEYRAGVSFGWRDPLIPPRCLHSVGDSSYVETGDEFLEYFVDLAGLTPEDCTLDVGCGTGRMARPLVRYLTAGTYDGIDIVAPSIAWCQRVYRRCPNFRFHTADIYNKMYNPTGKKRAFEYGFPFKSSSFNFVFLTSVFTHMLPQDMEHYLSEIGRVMKPGARCLITYFLLNPESLKLIQEGGSKFTFRHPLPGCRIENDEVPEGAVAYDETQIRTLYQEYGLKVLEPVHYGLWCGRKNGLSFQDIVIARKADAPI